MVGLERNPPRNPKNLASGQQNYCQNLSARQSLGSSNMSINLLKTFWGKFQENFAIYFTFLWKYLAKNTWGIWWEGVQKVLKPFYTTFEGISEIKKAGTWVWKGKKLILIQDFSYYFILFPNSAISIMHTQSRIYTIYVLAFLRNWLVKGVSSVLSFYPCVIGMNRRFTGKTRFIRGVPCVIDYSRDIVLRDSTAVRLSG